MCLPLYLFMYAYRYEGRGGPWAPQHLNNDGDFMIFMEWRPMFLELLFVALCVISIPPEQDATLLAHILHISFNSNC